VKPGDRAPRDEPEQAARAALEQAQHLLASGERQAARSLLAPIADGGTNQTRAALALLAAMDESEGRPQDAIARWQAILADQIDDDEAWAQLARLRPEMPASGASPMGVSAAAPTLDSGAGVRLSRFEIVGELGRGTFATVYRVRDRSLGIDLALKVLHPRPAGGRDGGSAVRTDVGGFFAEARAVGALRHPGIVTIYDLDEPTGTLAMELVPGGTLRERLRAVGGGTRGLPTPELLALASKLVAALDHLHAHGFVHADLSPRNVLLRAPGDPVIVDFGGGRLGHATDQPAGTPLYLAPEQFAGAPPSADADRFAAGAILWEAATGHPMRTREDLLAGRFAPRPLPARATLPTILVTLIETLTAPAPEHRRAKTPP
jgi:hypothetical protein